MSGCLAFLSSIYSPNHRLVFYPLLIPVRGLFFFLYFWFLTLWCLFSFFLLYFCVLTLCHDSNSKFINCDGFSKTSQVLGSFMTKSINRHCVMGLIAIVAGLWRYLKTLRKFRQKSSQIKWFFCSEASSQRHSQGHLRSAATEADIYRGLNSYDHQNLWPAPDSYILQANSLTAP